jgi:hypothetical protein
MLAALVFPVFAQAKRASGVAGTISNLRQQWLVVKLYQEANGGEGSYADPATLNLPTSLTMHLTNNLGTPESLWRSPCGRHPQWASTTTDYNYRIYPWDNPSFIAELQTYQENYLLSRDDNCNTPDVDIDGSWDVKRGVGVLLSGSVLKRTARGRMDLSSFYSSPIP